MNLSQLEYIVALQQYRNFSLAAENCHITQPTLSIQIQKLEQELGIIIFDRTKHPVVPTQEGLLLIEQAQNILQEIKQLQKLALNAREIVKGTLRIAIHPSVAPYLLPLFLVPFSKNYPDIKIEIRELHTYQMVKRLQKDTADVGITLAPIATEGFYEIPLFKENIAAYLHPQHPLAKKECLKLSDINLQELLLTEETENMAHPIAALQENNTSPQKKAKIVYLSSSVETIRKIVEQQGGITLIPQLATHYMGNRRKEYVRPFEAPQPSRQIVMIVQRGFEKQRLIDVLQKSILQHLPPKLRNSKWAKNKIT